MRSHRAALQPVSEAVLRTQEEPRHGQGHYRARSQIPGNHLSNFEESMDLRGLPQLRSSGENGMNHIAACAATLLSEGWLRLLPIPAPGDMPRSTLMTPTTESTTQNRNNSGK